MFACGSLGRLARSSDHRALLIACTHAADLDPFVGDAPSDAGDGALDDGVIDDAALLAAIARDPAAWP